MSTNKIKDFIKKINHFNFQNIKYAYFQKKYFKILSRALVNTSLTKICESVGTC